MLLALACLGANLVGAIPFGLVVTRLWAQKDVREVGSGNIGATNVARAAGKGAAVLTLLLDAAKGAIPTWLALRAFGVNGAVSVGAAAFLGHVYPVYLRFRGGKGVATGFGVFLVLTPLPALAAFATYGLVLALAKVSALGSLAALVVLGVGVALTAPHAIIGLFLGMGAVTLWRHRVNLGQLAGRSTAPRTR